jgi:hypothetical protein
LVRSHSPLTLASTPFFPKNKVILGSDYPFPLGEQHAGKLIEDSRLSRQTKVFAIFATLA